MLIEFINKKDFDISDEFLMEIEHVTAIALDYEGFYHDSEICIVFVDNEEIREINKKYRQKDSETDVLSFSSYEFTPGKYNFTPEEEPIQLGDIVISYEKAVSQAEKYGHSLLRELAFLTVHSVLHLLGYDHQVFDDAAVMEEKQDKILEEANIVE